MIQSRSGLTNYYKEKNRREKYDAFSLPERVRLDRRHHETITRPPFHNLENAALKYLTN